MIIQVNNEVFFKLFFSTIFFSFILVRDFTPNLIKRNPLVNKPNVLSSEDKKGLTTGQAKIKIMKKIGKTDNQILMYKVATFSKNVLKYGMIPVSLFTSKDAFFKYSVAYCGYFGFSKILKKYTKKPRPDGSNSRSFPSGHTASAFLGAFFIHYLFGWKVAFVPYLLSIFVGLSRVYCNSHTIIDVLGGVMVSAISVFIGLRFK